MYEAHWIRSDIDHKYNMMSINSRHVVATITTVSLLLLQAAASDEDSSCSLCDCLENNMNTLCTLIERRIERSLLLQLDECATDLDSCDDNADCTDTEGSFTCTCRPGYEGNGISCSDIDECADGTHNCDANADCTNSVGGFTCQCRVGFDGDGETCDDINECTSGTANCVQEANCANTIGSFTCTCPSERSDTNGREGEGCFALSSAPECGDGDWFTVISLDLQDAQQNCPSGWMEDTNPFRTCMNPGSSCAVGFQVTIDRPFTRVSGRAVGYQVDSTEAFNGAIAGTQDLNGRYVDGLSVTYTMSESSTRNHIWTFAAGVSESTDARDSFSCPCLADEVSPPDFVQDNYFCESGNPNTATSSLGFLSADPLWDGDACEGGCCDGSFSSVPWFCTTLDSEVESGAVIEVRHCVSASSEDIAVQALEIYIQ